MKPTDLISCGAANPRVNPVDVPVWTRLPAEEFHEVLVPRNEGHMVVQQPRGGGYVMYPSQTVTLSAPHSLYAIGKPVGKSTVQVGRLPTPTNVFLRR